MHNIRLDGHFGEQTLVKVRYWSVDGIRLLGYLLTACNPETRRAGNMAEIWGLSIRRGGGRHGSLGVIQLAWLQGDDDL